MLLRSPIRRLQDLVAQPSLEVGDVTEVGDAAVTISLLGGGGTVIARGTATLGQRVYVRGGVVEGEAPLLPLEVIGV